MTELQGALISDGHCKVTVVGERRRVDLALPARAPIAEYVGSVARLVGQPEEDDAFPPAWSFALAGARPLAPAGSLVAAGVVDGAVLYLCDVLEGEADEPLVLEIDEQVDEAVERLGTRPWDRPARAAAAYSAGALWLAAVTIGAAVTVPRAQAALPSLLGLFAGVFATAVAWGARKRSWALPGWIRLATVLCAIPDFAFAAARLGPLHASAAEVAVNAAMGALIGTVAVLSVAPGTVTMALPVAGALAVCTTAVLGALKANVTESAAAVTVLCVALGALAPWSVARLAMFSPQGRLLEEVGPEAVSRLVERAHTLLLAWNILLATAAAAAMVVLAQSSNPYALSMAGCAAVALWTRSSGFKLMTEALPGALAAAAGLAALAFCAPGHLHGAWWVGPVTAGAAGLLLVLLGLAAAFRVPAGQSERPGWHAFASGLCSIACVPLAVGVFGVYAHFVSVGHGL